MVDKDQKANLLIPKDFDETEAEQNELLASIRQSKRQGQKIRRLMQNIHPDEKRELTTLSRTDMDRAQELIDREHPLKNTLIWVILPFLKPIKNWLCKCIPKQHAPDEDSDNEKEDQKEE